MNKFQQSVLILDDDDSVRESLGYFFEDQGWSVILAATAEEALEILTHEKPDGAIVDIRLPGMDGTMFIRKLSQTYPRVMCVIYTGSPEYRAPESITALSQVSSEVFNKPVADLSELEEALLRKIEEYSKKEQS